MPSPARVESLSGLSMSQAWADFDGMIRYDVCPFLEADIGPLKRCIPKKTSSLPSAIFQWLGELYGVVHIV